MMTKMTNISLQFTTFVSKANCTHIKLLTLFMFFQFASLAIAQDDSYRGLKRVHSLSEIDETKSYVFMALGEDNQTYALSREAVPKINGALKSVAIHDFYGSADICNFKFKQLNKKKPEYEIRFANDDGFLATVGTDARLKAVTQKDNSSVFKFYLADDADGISIHVRSVDGEHIGISQDCKSFKIYAYQPMAYIYEYTPQEMVGEVDIKTQEGYGTYFLDKPFVMPHGLKGCIITDADASKGDLQVRWKYKEGDIVPANMALLVKGEMGKNYVLLAPEEEIPSTKSVVGNSSTDKNYLRGSVVEETTTAPDGELAEDYKFYKLYYVTEVNSDGTSSKHLAFYWGEQSGGVFKNGANKAYLAIPSFRASYLREFSLPNDPPTGILCPTDDAAPIKKQPFVYRLDGTKLYPHNHPKSLDKGVYIVNGHKVMVK